jgi:class 3 adenylate cyclase
MATNVVDGSRTTRAGRTHTRAPQVVHRRHVVTTIVFTDIVGSTGLVAASGDDGWVDFLLWHDVVVRRLLGDHGGREVKHLGDGFFAVFDDPAAAVACALAVVALLAEPGPGRPGVAVRVGIHRAEVVQVGRDYVGRGVHEAARITALAAGGEVLASACTVAGVVNGSTSEPRTVGLRGLDDGLDVVSIRAAARGRRAP